MATWVIISGVSALVAILAVLVGWAAKAVKKMNEAAYDKGAHATEHITIGKDIGIAHRRLDVVEGDVSALKGSVEANAETHIAMMKNIDDVSARVVDLDSSVNGRLDRILEILVQK